MFKILVSDKLAEQGLEILKKEKDFEVDYKPGISKEELMEIIGDYDAIIIRSATKLPREVLEKAKKLKAIGRAGIGVDNIDIDSATEFGIVVMNTPQGNTITTAEHTIALMMSLTRNIPQATASMKSGKWEKSKFIGTEIFNKTLGIIGIGNIGTIVADRARGLKMKVIGYDPYISEETALKKGIKLVDFDTLLKESDFITIHTPLTNSTKNMINKETISRMKDGVRIICCARGGIVNEDDLYEALKSGKVKGAALDVFAKEPPDFNHPLFKCDNFICTPHLGASTTEAQINVAIAIAEQMIDFLKKGIIKNAINVPSVSAEILKNLAPFITLGEKLGAFVTQMCSDVCGFTDVFIDYYGQISKYDVTPITLSILKGLLTPMLGDNVNFVNAQYIARDRGIKLHESKSENEKNYSSLIGVSTLANGKKISIEGTVFGKDTIRVVSINNFRVEAEPKGHLILIYNYDKPGVIGNIGTLLGKHNINIGNMQFGREKPGGMAISLLEVDEKVSPELIEEIKNLPNIINAQLIEL